MVCKIIIEEVMARAERSMRKCTCACACVCVFKFSAVKQTITMFSTISNVLKRDFICFEKNRISENVSFCSLSYGLWSYGFRGMR